MGFRNSCFVILVAFVKLKIICTGLHFKENSVYAVNLGTFWVKKRHLQNPISLAWLHLLVSLKYVKHQLSLHLQQIFYVFQGWVLKSCKYFFFFSFHSQGCSRKSKRSTVYTTQEIHPLFQPRTHRTRLHQHFGTSRICVSLWLGWHGHLLAPGAKWRAYRNG